MLLFRAPEEPLRDLPRDSPRTSGRSVRQYVFPISVNLELKINFLLPFVDGSRCAFGFEWPDGMGRATPLLCTWFRPRFFGKPG